MNNDLTKREIKIIKLSAHGKTNREIAEYLNLSEQTVKNHLYSIYRTLGVDSKYQAFLELGWLTPPELSND